MELKKSAYNSGKIELKSYIGDLAEFFGTGHVLNERFPNVALLIDTIEKENNIDFNACEREKAYLLDEVIKVSSERERYNLVNLAEKTRKGEIERDSFYIMLIEKAQLIGMDIKTECANILGYTSYLRTYKALDKNRLMDELDFFIDHIAIAFIRNDEERRLYQLSRHIDLVDKFFDIRLTRKEYHEFQGLGKDNILNGIYYFVKRYPGKGLTNEDAGRVKKIASCIDIFNAFYELSNERDRVFIQNVERLLKDRESLMLICGGFHLQNIIKHLRKDGYSYVVIVPRFDHEEKTTYYRLLSGGKTDLEEAISGRFSNLAIANALNKLGSDDVLSQASLIYEKVVALKGQCRIEIDGRKYLFSAEAIENSAQLVSLADGNQIYFMLQENAHDRLYVDDGEDDGGLIGKWRLSKGEKIDFKYAPAKGRYVARFKARNIQTYREENIELYASIADPKERIFERFLRTGISEIDDVLDEYLGLINEQKRYILESNEYGIYGFGFDNQLAVLEELAEDRVAKFHEVAHGALKWYGRVYQPRNPLRKAIIGVIENGGASPDAYIQKKVDRYIHRTDYLSDGEYEDACASFRNYWRDHYLLRILQKSVFKEEDAKPDEKTTERIQSLGYQVNWVRRQDMMAVTIMCGFDFVPGDGQPACGELIFRKRKKPSSDRKMALSKEKLLKEAVKYARDSDHTNALWNTGLRGASTIIISFGKKSKSEALTEWCEDVVARHILGYKYIPTIGYGLSESDMGALKNDAYSIFLAQAVKERARVGQIIANVINRKEVTARDKVRLREFGLAYETLRTRQKEDNKRTQAEIAEGAARIVEIVQRKAWHKLTPEMLLDNGVAVPAAGVAETQGGYPPFSWDLMGMAAVSGISAIMDYNQKKKIADIDTKPTVVVDGFGDPGMSIIKSILRQLPGSVRLIGVSDSKNGLIKQDSQIYLPSITDMIKRKVSGEIIDLALDYKDEEAIAKIMKAEVPAADCDILILADRERTVHGREAFTNDEVDAIKAKIVIEAVQGLFTQEQIKKLNKRGIIFISSLWLNGGMFYPAREEFLHRLTPIKSRQLRGVMRTHVESWVRESAYASMSEALERFKKGQHDRDLAIEIRRHEKDLWKRVRNFSEGQHKSLKEIFQARKGKEIYTLLAIARKKVAYSDVVPLLEGAVSNLWKGRHAGLALATAISETAFKQVIYDDNSYLRAVMGIAGDDARERRLCSYHLQNLADRNALDPLIKALEETNIFRSSPGAAHIRANAARALASLYRKADDTEMIYVYKKAKGSSGIELVRSKAFRSDGMEKAGDICSEISNLASSHGLEKGVLKDLDTAKETGGITIRRSEKTKIARALVRALGDTSEEVVCWAKWAIAEYDVKVLCLREILELEREAYKKHVKEARGGWIGEGEAQVLGEFTRNIALTYMATGSEDDQRRAYEYLRDARRLFRHMVKRGKALLPISTQFILARLLNQMGEKEDALRAYVQLLNSHELRRVSGMSHGEMELLLTHVRKRAIWAILDIYYPHSPDANEIIAGHLNEIIDSEDMQVKPLGKFRGRRTTEEREELFARRFFLIREFLEKTYEKSRRACDHFNIPYLPLLLTYATDALPPMEITHGSEGPHVLPAWLNGLVAGDIYAMRRNIESLEIIDINKCFTESKKEAVDDVLRRHPRFALLAEKKKTDRNFNLLKRLLYYRTFRKIILRLVQRGIVSKKGGGYLDRAEAEKYFEGIIEKYPYLRNFMGYNAEKLTNGAYTLGQVIENKLGALSVDTQPGEQAELLSFDKSECLLLIELVSMDKGTMEAFLDFHFLVEDFMSHGLIHREDDGYDPRRLYIENLKQGPDFIDRVLEIYPGVLESDIVAKLAIRDDLHLDGDELNRCIFLLIDIFFKNEFKRILASIVSGGILKDKNERSLSDEELRSIISDTALRRHKGNIEIPGERKEKFIELIHMFEKIYRSHTSTDKPNLLSMTNYNREILFGMFNRIMACSSFEEFIVYVYLEDLIFDSSGKKVDKNEAVRRLNETEAFYKLPEEMKKTCMSMLEDTYDYMGVREVVEEIITEGMLTDKRGDVVKETVFRDRLRQSPIYSRMSKEDKATVHEMLRKMGISGRRNGSGTDPKMSYDQAMRKAVWKAINAEGGSFMSIALNEGDKSYLIHEGIVARRLPENTVERLKKQVRYARSTPLGDPGIGPMPCGKRPFEDIIVVFSMPDRIVRVGDFTFVVALTEDGYLRVKGKEGERLVVHDVKYVLDPGGDMPMVAKGIFKPGNRVVLSSMLLRYGYADDFDGLDAVLALLRQMRQSSKKTQEDDDRIVKELAIYQEEKEQAIADLSVSLPDSAQAGDVAAGAGDGGEIGKWMPKYGQRICFSYKESEGYYWARYNARHMDTGEEKTLELIADRVSRDQDIFGNFRRTGIRKLDALLEALLKEVPSENRYIIRPSIKHTLGVGRDGVLAISGELMYDDIALFHETAHLALRRKVLFLELNDESDDAYLSIKNKKHLEIAKINLDEEALAIARIDSVRSHYLLRALQRQLWGMDDWRLTNKIWQMSTKEEPGKKSQGESDRCAAIEEEMRIARRSIRNVEKEVQTILIVNDDNCLRGDDSDRTMANNYINKLPIHLRRVFGHKRGNGVHICTSYAQAGELVARLQRRRDALGQDPLDWTNTFIYVDSRIYHETEDTDVLTRFIRIKLELTEQGSILISRPVFGYSAYSQLYSDLIEKVRSLYEIRSDGPDSGRKEDIIKSIKRDMDINGLADDMAGLVANMTLNGHEKTRKYKAGILNTIDGIVEMSLEDIGMDEFMSGNSASHAWCLPQVVGTDWDMLRRAIDAEIEYIRKSA